VSLPDVDNADRMLNAKNVSLPDVDKAKNISLPDVNGEIFLSPLMKQHVEMVIKPLSIGDALLVASLLILKPASEHK
jgi:hypothetical protein